MASSRVMYNYIHMPIHVGDIHMPIHVGDHVLCVCCTHSTTDTRGSG